MNQWRLSEWQAHSAMAAFRRKSLKQYYSRRAFDKTVETLSKMEIFHQLVCTVYGLKRLGKREVIYQVLGVYVNPAQNSGRLMKVDRK